MAGETLRRSLYSSFLGQWVAATAMVASSLVVARLLTPDELGVYTVAMGLTVIVQALQYVGGSEYVLYSHTLDKADRRAAFGISVCGALVVALVLVLLAKPAAAFYRNEGVVGLMMIFAVNILINIFAAPVSSMLVRNERFALVGLSNAMTSLIQSIGSIILIYMGFKYYAMALAGTLAACASVAYHVLVGREFVLLRPTLRGARKLVGFSSTMFFLNVLDQIYNVIPQILLGRISGLAAAAMYGRANVITQIYGQVVARAVDPVITARIAATRRDGEDGAQVYFTSSNMLLAISAPFFGFVALYAHEIVPIMFGDQWGAAVLPMRILCCGFIVWPLMSPTSSLLIAAGRRTTLLKLRFFMTAARLGLVAFAAQWGLGAAAGAVTASIVVNLVVSVYFICDVANMRAGDYLRRLTGSVLVGLASLAVAGGALALAGMAGLHGWATVLVGVVAIAVTWIGMLVVLKHPIYQEAEVVLAGVNRFRARRKV